MCCEAIEKIALPAPQHQSLLLTRHVYVLVCCFTARADNSTPLLQHTQVVCFSSCPCRAGEPDSGHVSSFAVASVGVSALELFVHPSSGSCGPLTTLRVLVLQQHSLTVVDVRGMVSLEVLDVRHNLLKVCIPVIGV